MTALARKHRRTRALCAVATTLLTARCDTPSTTVVFENQYPASADRGLVIYRAFWQSVALAAPVAPGAASAPQNANAASANTAYVLLAPGWDPTSDAMPAELVVLQSRSGYALEFNSALRIPVSDATFMGNCAAGSALTQAQADFITQEVFAMYFTNYTYNAAACALTAAPRADAGGPG